MCRSVQDQKMTSVILNEQVDYACFKSALIDLELLTEWKDDKAEGKLIALIIKVTNVKFTKLVHKALSKIKDLWRCSLDSFLAFFGNALISGSHFEHYLDFFRLFSHVRKNNFTNMGDSITCSIPSKRRFSAVFCHLISCISPGVTSKIICKPPNQLHACASDLDNSLKVLISGDGAAGMISYVDTPFSINNSCKVSALGNRIFFPIVSSISSHISLIVDNSYIIQDLEINCHRERLKRVEAERLSDSLSSIEMWRGKPEEVSPPEMVIKVTDCIIQDQDPKKNGVYKFSLIDLEARWGDRAQAKAA